MTYIVFFLFVLMPKNCSMVCSLDLKGTSVQNYKTEVLHVFKLVSLWTLLVPICREVWKKIFKFCMCLSEMFVQSSRSWFVLPFRFYKLKPHVPLRTKLKNPVLVFPNLLNWMTGHKLHRDVALTTGKKNKKNKSFRNDRSWERFRRPLGYPVFPDLFRLTAPCGREI